MANDLPATRRFERRDAPSRRGPDSEPSGERRAGLYWLFLVPAVATLLPWIFNSRNPTLIGIPFFYWYQLIWVPITVAITVAVYRATRRPR